MIQREDFLREIKDNMEGFFESEIYDLGEEHGISDVIENKYGTLHEEFALKEVSGVALLAKVDEFVSKGISLEDGVNTILDSIPVEEYKKKVYESINVNDILENRFENIRAKAKEIFIEKITLKVTDIFEDYLDDFPSFVYSRFKGTIEEVTDEQVDLGFDELLEWLKEENISEDDVLEKVEEYVDENYDRDFLYQLVEREVDDDELTKDLEDELVLMLINTEPYGYAPREYWEAKVKEVSSVQELGNYAGSQDGSHRFVEDYASNWEEEIPEKEEY